MPICLLTGASGFLGRCLIERLLRESDDGLEIVALGRRASPGGKAHFFRQVDLSNQNQVSHLIQKLAPSLVYHLAGQTPPASSAEFYSHNTLATIHLLDALRTHAPGCRVVMVGSAAELGPVEITDLPVDETRICQPTDAYGLSKWLATSAGLAARPPLEVVVARIFNPVGPGMPASQALGRFAAMLAQGQGPVHLVVGPLEARRDFVDVRDVARALVLLASKGRPGQVYHVGTGQSHRIGDGLDRLIALSGREVVIEIAPPQPGSGGPLDSRADVRKILDETGWRAEISWEQSLKDLWLDAVASQAQVG